MTDNPNKKDHWFREMLAYGPGGKISALFIVGIVAILAAITLPIIAWIKTQSNSVVVYTSQDEEYAEPIFKKFTEETGINVRAVYDNEAAKTVGLVNRLIAERNHPQCDVFWNNEELRTRQLKEQHVLRAGWATFGYRTRRLVVNTNLMPLVQAPHDTISLTNKQFYNKVAIAYPLFGTTSTHFLALRQSLGRIGWENWCQALAANKPFVVDGNSVVVKMVGKGEAQIGLTDSDDVLAGQREGLAVDSIIPSHGFSIQNTAATVVNGPHPDEGNQLLNFLSTPQTRADLKKAGAIEATNVLPSDWEKWDDLLTNQNRDLDFLKGLFLR